MNKRYSISKMMFLVFGFLIMAFVEVGNHSIFHENCFSFR